MRRERPDRATTNAARGVLGVALAALTTLAGCGGDQPERLQPAKAHDADRFAVHTTPRRGGGGAGLDTGLRDPLGNPIRARCSACHADARAPAPEIDAAAVAQGALKDVHTGLTLRHGTLRCGQCHGATGADGRRDLDTLRRADGRAIAFDDVMELCAQCHGPQTRDYRNGSHGGMRGHWDLRYGPRERNQCVHCHDPHAPAYVGMVPAPPPKDRFLRRSTGAHGEGGAP